MTKYEGRDRAGQDRWMDGGVEEEEEKSGWCTGGRDEGKRRKRQRAPTPPRWFSPPTVTVWPVDKAQPLPQPSFVHRGTCVGPARGVVDRERERECNIIPLHMLPYLPRHFMQHVRILPASLLCCSRLLFSFSFLLTTCSTRLLRLCRVYIVDVVVCQSGAFSVARASLLSCSSKLKRQHTVRSASAVVWAGKNLTSSQGVQSGHLGSLWRRMLCSVFPQVYMIMYNMCIGCLTGGGYSVVGLGVIFGTEIFLVLSPLGQLQVQIVVTPTGGD